MLISRPNFCDCRVSNHPVQRSSPILGSKQRQLSARFFPRFCEWTKGTSNSLVRRCSISDGNSLYPLSLVNAVLNRSELNSSETPGELPTTTPAAEAKHSIKDLMLSQANQTCLIARVGQTHFGWSARKCKSIHSFAFLSFQSTFSRTQMSVRN